jgi:hypothetical protein
MIMIRSVHFIRFIAAICLLGLFSVSTIQAQQGLTYQAVARNLSGQPISNQPLTVRITIHAESPDGELIWGEEHQVATNGEGTVMVLISLQ